MNKMDKMKIYENYTKADYSDMIQNFKNTENNEAYKKFQKSLEPGGGDRIRYGIRMGVLREYARRIKKGDFRGFLSIAKDNSHEETVLMAIVISSSKMPVEDRINYLKTFLPKVDAWSICDALAGDLKSCRKTDREEIFKFAASYVNSEEEFEVRFAAAIFLWHYTDDEYSERALNYLQEINHPGYYARMGLAWAISQFYIFQRKKVLEIIKAKELNPWVQNKAIQKIRESFRVSDEDKEMLVAYKIK